MTILYKIVGPDGAAIHGGSGRWAMPKGVRPGRWMPPIANVEACRRGYHLVTARGIIDWLPRAPQTALLCDAEGRGETDRDGEKGAFEQARILLVVGVLDEVSMRLAAADMAERVLPLFGAVMPTDDRPAQAIRAARDYARGKISAAARDAASAAAWDAASAAAWAAASAAAWAAARDAAWAAASDAASAAARDAASAAARDAARDANAEIIIAQAAARLAEKGDL